MPQNDALTTKPSGEVIEPMNLKPDAIIFSEEAREKAIQMLRQIPSLMDVVKKLSEGTTYQAVFTPEALKRLNDGSATLDKKDYGLFGALIRDVKTGRVTEHVNLKKVPPDVLGSLNQLAMHHTLANIVHRLEIIEKKISEVIQGQFNDRIAEVKTGIRLYNKAMITSDANSRHDLLLFAIQNLEAGRSKLLEATDFDFIDKLPRNRIRMFFTLNPDYYDIPKYVHSKAEPVWKAAYAIVEASRYLVLAFSALNEPNVMRISLQEVEREVIVLQDKMGKILNWLSPTSNWRETLITFSQGVLPSIRDLDDIPKKQIVIEFQPKEFAPPEGVEP